MKTVSRGYENTKRNALSSKTNYQRNFPNTPVSLENRVIFLQWYLLLMYLVRLRNLEVKYIT